MEEIVFIFLHRLKLIILLIQIDVVSSGPLVW